MTTTLSKTSGDVKEEATITITDQHVVELRLKRISKRGLSKLSSYPPSTYAPQTAEDKVQELVDTLTNQGFSLDVPGVLGFESYSFNIELIGDTAGVLDGVVQGLGSCLYEDPVSKVVSVRDTSFVVTTAGTTKRLNAAVNATSTTTGQSMLLNHIVMAACLHTAAECFDSHGNSVDLQERIMNAYQAGLLSERQLDALYKARRLRRPVVYVPQAVPGAYRATF